MGDTNGIKGKGDSIMSPAVSEGLRASPRQNAEGLADYAPASSSLAPNGPSWSLLVTGLVVVGLGLMAWNYLGPDIRRYLRIRNM
jgi:hypothetical protein